MTSQQDEIDQFLFSYGDPVAVLALELRKKLLKSLPDITEQLDKPARIIGYGYGPRYIDTICVIIPSKKGVKLGFYKGNELPDPAGLLEGTGKISRYVVIDSANKIKSPALKKLLADALEAYRKRTSGNPRSAQ